MVKLIARFNGGQCPYFTDGKTYEAKPIGSGRVGEVRDDRGNERVIPLDGSKCAHIITPGLQVGRTLHFHEAVGTWEVVGTLYDDCVTAGLKIDNHESDLYIEDTPEARALMAAHNVRLSQTFTSQIDGKRWIDVPFAFMPYWRKRA